MIDKVARAADLCAAHADGKSVTDIAADAGLCVKRVRELLRLRGIKTGYRIDRRQAKEEAKAQRKEASAMARWGISATRYEHLRGGKLMTAFKRQKHSAAKRGIQFEMNFGQWLTVWHESGKLSERGRRKGQYVMSRKMDAGPYAVGNVEIKTCSENVKEVRSREAQAKVLARSIEG
jgi:hypothetical protein